eukprot:Opistho-2@10962
MATLAPTATALCRAAAAHGRGRASSQLKERMGALPATQPFLSESEACNTTPCPINCAYGAFGPFSNCTAECGGGNRTKERVITTEGQFGGTECTEPLSVTETCNSEPCANNCKREVKCFCALKKKFAQQEQSCTPTNRRRRESYMMD